MQLLDTVGSILGVETSELVTRMRKNAVLLGTLAFFLLVMLVFMLVAANVALSSQVGPLYAPLIIAGTAAVVALVLYIVFVSMEKKAMQREAERRLVERNALIASATATALPILVKSPALMRVGLPIGGALAALYLLLRKGSSDDPPPDAS